MTAIRTVGLPVMHKERGERRAFLPSFVTKLDALGLEIHLEHGYGEGMGMAREDYLAAGGTVRFVSREEVYAQDLVVLLRAPNLDDLSRMKRGASLFSMLHYDTRPALAKEILRRGIKSYSLDSIADDHGRRIVVTYELTAYGGVREAFRQMVSRRSDFYSRDREPIRVTVLGMGHLGIQAGRACFAMGEESIRSGVEQSGARGSVVTYLERGITGFPNEVNRVLRSTDLLIDATKRPDPRQYIIRNTQLSELPESAVILDLTADPYDTSTDPIMVKAIEGIPTGTLDQWVFDPDDPVYATIPAQVDTTHRRVVVSCNAWPGVTPFECMRVYEEQLTPFISLICRRERVGPDSGDALERALYRSSIECFLDGASATQCPGPC